MHYSPTPRSAQTTIPCRRCGAPLTAKRDCTHAYLRCESCRKDVDLREYAQDMDAALEAFLEAVNVDRV